MIREKKIASMQRGVYVVELMKPINENLLLNNYAPVGYILITEHQIASVIENAPIVAFLINCEIEMLELVEVGNKE